jgi:hypothetical protein
MLDRVENAAGFPATIEDVAKMDRRNTESLGGLHLVPTFGPEFIPGFLSCDAALLAENSTAERRFQIMNRIFHFSDVVEGWKIEDGF